MAEQSHMPYPIDPQTVQRWITAFVFLHFAALLILLGMHGMPDDPDRYLLARSVVAALLGIGYLARFWTDLKYGWAMDIRGRWRSRVEEPLDYCLATGMNAFFLLACIGMLIQWHW